MAPTACGAAGGAMRASSTAPTTTTSGACRRRTTCSLFETLSLEGFQAGLSWLTILRKREGFRRGVRRIRASDGRAVRRARRRRGCSATAAIVRHRGKIEAVINNASRALELVDAEGSLAAYFWGFEPAAQRGKLDRATLAERPLAAGGEGARARPEAARLEVRRRDRRSTRSCRRPASSTTT